MSDKERKPWHAVVVPPEKEVSAWSSCRVHSVGLQELVRIHAHLGKNSDGFGFGQQLHLLPSRNCFLATSSHYRLRLRGIAHL